MELTNQALLTVRHSSLRFYVLFFYRVKDHLSVTHFLRSPSLFSVVWVVSDSDELKAGIFSKLSECVKQSNLKKMLISFALLRLKIVLSLIYIL